MPPVGDVRRGPIEEPPGVGGGEVHAAVAADVAEIAVPEGAVQRHVLLEVHDVGHLVDGVRLTEQEVVHRGGDVLEAAPGP